MPSECKECDPVTNSHLTLAEQIEIDGGKTGDWVSNQDLRNFEMARQKKLGQRKS